MKQIITFISVFGLIAFTQSSFAGQLEAKWSSAGKLKGEFKHCIAINEPLEKANTTWDDNYLCFNKKKHGFKYSYANKINNLNCKSLDIKGGAWEDNYLCAKSTDFDFFQRRLPGGYTCIRIIEESDPNPRANGSQGNSNHFCLKK